MTIPMIAEVGNMAFGIEALVVVCGFCLVVGEGGGRLVVGFVVVAGY